MKNKFTLIVLIFLILGGALYFYIYKDHRDISSEKATFTTTTDHILQEYKEDEKAASKKYLDKTIIVQGQITNLDLTNNTIVLDRRLSGKLIKAFPSININDSVSIKGRFIGYDELLEEIKMDEVSIIK